MSAGPRRIKNPHEVFKKGEPVTAKVLRVDEDNRRVSLGMKQVNDIWGDWFQAAQGRRNREGQSLAYRHVRRVRRTGRNIEGLCHNTEITDRRRGDDGSGMNRTSTGAAESAGPLEPGKEYDFKIIKISPESRKIALSYKAAGQTSGAPGNCAVPLDDEKLLRLRPSATCSAKTFFALSLRHFHRGPVVNRLAP